MGILNHDQIRELRQAVISANLARSRPAFLTGINETFKATLPDEPAPGDQFLADLNVLNTTGFLEDGSVPLEVWLGNAVDLAKPRVEGTIFEKALETVRAYRESAGAKPPTAPQRRERNGEKAPSPDELEQPTPYAQAWWRSALFILLIAVAVFGLSRGKWEDSCEPWRIARTLTDGLQLIVVVCAFLWVGFDGELDDGDERSKEFVEPFRRYWKRLWLFWCVFYLYYTVREAIEDNAIHHHDPLGSHWAHWSNVVTNLLQNLQGMTLLILFWMMLRPILDAKDKKFRLKRAWGALSAVWYIGLALAQSLLLLAFRLDGYYSAAVDFVAALATGIVAMVCMGMFIGRLESTFLDVHPLELAALYAYASIQPFFPLVRVLGEHQTDKTTIILELSLKSLACALKLGLYFVVRRQLKTHRLAFYMQQQQALRARASEDWKAFQREQ